MANLYPAEFEALLKEYLSDGVLTEKERLVLLKKAEKLGLDVDEVDLYLEAKKNKLRMNDIAAAQRLKGKTCPHCGAPVPQLTDKCPECGNLITAEASEELKNIIETLEKSVIRLKSCTNVYDIKAAKAKVEKNLRNAEIYFGSNPKIKSLVASVKEEVSTIEKREKKSTVKTIICIVLYLGFLFTLAIIAKHFDL